MINPFSTLYVTERMDHGRFPDLFSPALVPNVQSLFHDGNVVVKGTQGTGKSMLLALLRTDIRISFEKRADATYPVPKALCNFITTGINLATDQALRFGSRWKGASPEKLDALRSFFSAYVNTWLLRDFLDSIALLLRSCDGRVWRDSNLGNSIQYNTFIEAACGSGMLGPECIGAASYEAIRLGLTQRIDAYLRALNGRSELGAERAWGDGGDMLGKPLRAIVSVAKSIGFLNPDTRVIVCLDQFEHLLDFETYLPATNFGLLREVVDDAIHLRDATLCFRVGTRPHAWKARRSERLRDYVELDLDELLRRTEHAKSAIFPKFATDVFERRLRSFGYDPSGFDAGDSLTAYFGKSPAPESRVKLFASPQVSRRIVQLPQTFPMAMREVVETVGRRSPLSAMLGIAWARQKCGDIINRPDSDSAKLAIQQFQNCPWEANEKKWWRKERKSIAVLQLAAASGQRVPMFGKQDILALSGASILVFGSICQHIWNCWLRTLGHPEQKITTGEMPVDFWLQDEGVRNASIEWRQKVSEEAWSGDVLARFIDTMGNSLHRWLVEDRNMSYPGGNGISLADSDLAQFPKVQAILTDGAGRGFLLQRRHTPKVRSRGPSTKWYLHPVLAPYYEITVSHTKEPQYIKAELVEEWLKSSDVAPLPRRDSARKERSAQRQLPGMENDE